MNYSIYWPSPCPPQGHLKITQLSPPASLLPTSQIARPHAAPDRAGLAKAGKAPRPHRVSRCSISGISVSLNDVLQVPHHSPGFTLGWCIDSRMGGAKEVKRRAEETGLRRQSGKSKVMAK